MLLLFYLVGIVLGGLAGCIAAGLAGMVMMAIVALAGRFSLAVTVPIASIAMYLASNRIAAHLRAGFVSGEIDGPGGIGAAALLLSCYAFAIAGIISIIVIGTNLWIKAPTRPASEH